MHIHEGVVDTLLAEELLAALTVAAPQRAVQRDGGLGHVTPPRLVSKARSRRSNPRPANIAKGPPATPTNRFPPAGRPFSRGAQLRPAPPPAAPCTGPA